MLLIFKAFLLRMTYPCALPDFALTNNFHYGLQNNLLIQTGVRDYEKDIDEFQQHEEEANPWFPRPDGHQGRPSRPEQEAGKGKEETGGVVPAVGPRADRAGPGKGAEKRDGKPDLWQR